MNSGPNAGQCLIISNILMIPIGAIIGFYMADSPIWQVVSVAGGVWIILALIIGCLGFLAWNRKHRPVRGEGEPHGD